MTQINIGDRVAFSRQFLKSTGQCTGWAPFARGTVSALAPLGGIALAVIEWDGGQGSKVLVSNLVRQDRIHLEAV